MVDVAAVLRFELLGRLRAWRGDGELDLGWPRQRAVLATLLLHANTAVSRAAIVDAVWGDAAPRSAANLVHTYVRRLRQVLDPDRARRAAGRVLVSSGSGYLLRLAPGQLDLDTFGRHLDRARRSLAGGDPAAALDAFDTALGLWRGAPLAGLSGPLVGVERVRLGELRLAAIEDRAEVALGLGRHTDLVAELSALTAEHPYRERLRELLMIALYRGGRRADALTVYADTRRLMVTELGIDPGQVLQRLHHDILNGRDVDVSRPAAGSRVDGGPPHPARSRGADGGPPHPAGSRGEDGGPPHPAGSRGEDGGPPHPAGVRPGGGPDRPVPRELPRDVPAFTGRHAELGELDAALTADEGGPPTVLISAVSGTAGVGKTALAVHWAHRVAGRFPDGTLYVDLRGYDPDRPLPPGEALAAFLRALGVDGADIPADPAERAGRYRTLLAGRRMLVVLDNARSVEQVRLLLPGEAACLAVVTSRDSLAALVARYGARRVDLDLLPPGDAVALLGRLIGRRVAADPEAAAALADRCVRLPLALRIAAELAASRPATSLAALADELADEQRRLDLLAAGDDPRTAVRAVFSWSYRHLAAATRRGFRFVGLHPGPDLDVYAAAALTGTTLDDAAHLLDRLTRAYLVHHTVDGRHAMHDLLRAYATALVSTEDGAEARQAAMTAMFDHYLASAAAAMDAIAPSERHRRPHIPPPATPIPAVAEPAAARAWLDRERATLVAVTGYTADRGWPGHATRLAATLTRYLETGGHYPDAITIHGHAGRAARHGGDPAGEAQALVSLGVIDRRQGRYEQAADHLRQALTRYRAIGDRGGEARALGNLGTVEWQLGRNGLAADHHQRALALFRSIGDRAGAARALGNLGTVYEPLGRYAEAADHLRQAIAAYREIGDRSGEAAARCNLGTVHQRQEQYAQATDQLQQALAIFADIGDRSGEAAARCNLGTVHQRQGRDEAAAEHHRWALAFYREVGDRGSEADALNDIGDALLATSRPDLATDRHAAALALAGDIGDRYEQARAHNGLARAGHATGDPDRARRHWRQALALYTDLAAPDTEEIRRRLAALDGDAPVRSSAPDPAKTPGPSGPSNGEAS